MLKFEKVFNMDKEKNALAVEKAEESAALSQRLAALENRVRQIESGFNNEIKS